MEQKSETLLEIHNLSVSFRMYDRGTEHKDLKVISDLHLRVYPGEIVAVAGSSGSGKSLLASAILGILPENATVQGHLHYKGEELTAERQKELRGSEIALVPQSVAYLDPLMKVGAQASWHPGGKQGKPAIGCRSLRGGRCAGGEVEPASGTQDDRSAGRLVGLAGLAGLAGSVSCQKMANIFERLGLPGNTAKLYPFQLSGGMARRVLVSTALVTDAELIIADEPTPGMSVHQALEALQMFRELADRGKAVILITHDIDLAFEFADRVAVFYAGTTVETAPASDFRVGLSKLRHPYSKALWRALPQNDFVPIPGTQPYAGNLPKGCLFAPRCPLASDECKNETPPVREIRGGEVRCYHAT